MRKHLLILIGLFFSITSIQAQPQPQDEVRLLLVGDPFAFAMNAARSALSETYGITLDIEIVSYNDMRLKTLQNARDFISGYDIISFDVVWLGEYHQENILLPLDDLLDEGAFNRDDFLAAALEASAYADTQYGIPIQPHPELLWYRQDIFDAQGLVAPETTSQLLYVAAQLHAPAQNRYGICWNAQRGQPLGQTMAHFYGAFGQPLINDNNVPTLNTERGIAAAQYALDLLAYSPPDILNMAWDQRILRYSSGGCAMTYGWGARAYIAEESATSQVVGLTAYSAAPHAPDSPAVTPLGIWSLGIPANIGERRTIAQNALRTLTSPPALTIIAKAGNGGMARRSLLNNDDLRQRYPAFATVAALAADDSLATWMRPAIPQWSQIADIMGTVYHDMLRGLYTPEEAAAEAQRQAEALFAPTGTP